MSSISEVTAEQISECREELAAANRVIGYAYAKIAEIREIAIADGSRAITDKSQDVMNVLIRGEIGRP